MMLLTNMNEISYFEAWRHWFNGDNVSSYYLWTFQILWWGRIGKLVSFISAFAVIADILGAERLREFGKSLHGRFTLQMVIKAIKDSFRPVWWLFLLLFSMKGKEEKDVIGQKYSKSKFGCINVSLAWAVCFYAFFVVYRDRELWRRFLYSIGIMAGVHTLVGPIIITSFIVLPMIILLCVDALFVEPVAWVLERQSLDKLIKTGSLTLLIVGFHFDLLAS